MVCKVCGSIIQRKFRTEAAIHLAQDRPLILVFPEILVCLDCGRPEFAESFVIPDHELRLLAKSKASSTKVHAGMTS